MVQRRSPTTPLATLALGPWVGQASAGSRGGQGKELGGLAGSSRRGLALARALGWGARQAGPLSRAASRMAPRWDRCAQGAPRCSPSAVSFPGSGHRPVLALRGAHGPWTEGVGLHVSPFMPEPGGETNQKAISRNSQPRAGAVWAADVCTAPWGSTGWPSGGDRAGENGLSDPDRPRRRAPPGAPHPERD